MTAPIATTRCPEAETLAAFVDDRLDAPERRTVIAHIADCAECRDVVLTADDLCAEEAAEDAPGGSEVRRFPRRTGWGVIAVAAAAALALVFLQPIRERLSEPAGVRALVAASEALDYRPTDARLAGGFPHRPVQQRMRGSADDPGDGFQAVALNVQADTIDGKGPARSLAAAYLLTGEHARAVATLEAELRKSTEAADVASAVAASRDQKLLVDLSAAYLARGSWNGDAGDLARALAVAERAWRLERTPEAAWNRAAAAEHLERDAEAVRAWNDYLALDSSSPWAAEARARLGNARR